MITVFMQQRIQQQKATTQQAKSSVPLTAERLQQQQEVNRKQTTASRWRLMPVSAASFFFFFCQLALVLAHSLLWVVGVLVVLLVCRFFTHSHDPPHSFRLRFFVKREHDDHLLLQQHLSFFTLHFKCVETGSQQLHSFSNQGIQSPPVSLSLIKPTNMNFFGKPPSKEDPIDQAKKWKREITRQARRLDRDIQAIERAEKKAMKECQKYAKKGELKAAKTLAKEIVST